LGSAATVPHPKALGFVDLPAATAAAVATVPTAAAGDDCGGVDGGGDGGDGSDGNDSKCYAQSILGLGFLNVCS
jgi:hypothetical protein